MQIKFLKLDHVQICIPFDKELEARIFYCDILGLKEIDKPDDLKKNGGFWLKVADIELHIGVEQNIAQSKRHPAFQVENLDGIKTYLLERKIKIREDNPLPNSNRFSFFDPFGNRIELLEKIKSPTSK